MELLPLLQAPELGGRALELRTELHRVIGLLRHVLEDGVRHLHTLDRDVVWILGRELLPVVRLVVELHLFVRKGMIEDRILESGTRTAAVLANRLFIRHLDVDDPGALQHILVEIREGFSEAILTTTGEFDDGGHLLVVLRVSGDLLTVGEVDAFDVQVPDERIVEPVLLVRPDALLPVTAEDVV